MGSSPAALEWVRARLMRSHSWTSASSPLQGRLTGMVRVGVPMVWVSALMVVPALGLVADAGEDSRPVLPVFQVWLVWFCRCCRGWEAWILHFICHPQYQVMGSRPAYAHLPNLLYPISFSNADTRVFE